MSNFYANKERRDKLSDLSEKLYGRRSYWQKLRKGGATIENIETLLTNIYNEVYGEKGEEI